MAKLIVLVAFFCFVTMRIEGREISNDIPFAQKFDTFDPDSLIEFETSVVGPELLDTESLAKPPRRPPIMADTSTVNAWPSDSKNKKWCIAKPSASETQLDANINFVCNQPSSVVDCRVIKQGGACFSPNNTVSHASVVMNISYRNTEDSRCDFNGSALIVYENPSFGSCLY